jgi:hypothetical protein
VVTTVKTKADFFGMEAGFFELDFGWKPKAIPPQQPELLFFVP